MPSRVSGPSGAQATPRPRRLRVCDFHELADADFGFAVLSAAASFVQPWNPELCFAVRALGRNSCSSHAPNMWTCRGALSIGLQLEMLPSPCRILPRAPLRRAFAVRRRTVRHRRLHPTAAHEFPSHTRHHTSTGPAPF